METNKNASHAENMILKRSLVLQSFAPLFILLAIKHIRFGIFWHLVVPFIKLFSDKGLVAVSIAVKNKNFGGVVIFIISLMWLFATLIIAIGFRGMQKSGFKSAGEQILIEDSQNDSGDNFRTVLKNLFIDIIKERCVKGSCRKYR